MIIIAPLFIYGSLSQNNSEFSIWSAFEYADSQSSSSRNSPFWVAIGWGLGYLGMPHVLSKFMGIDKTENLKKSRALGLSWQILALSASAMIGVLARVYFMERDVAVEKLFIVMTAELLHPFLFALLVCAIIAATLSTMDSQIIFQLLLLVMTFSLNHRWV